MNYDVMFVGGSYPMPTGGGSVNYVERLLSKVEGFSYMVLTSDTNPNDNKEFDEKRHCLTKRSKYIYHVLKSYKGFWLKKRLFLIIAIFQTVFCVLKYRPKMIFFTEFSSLAFSLYIIKLFCGAKIGLFTYAEEITQLKNDQNLGNLFKSTLLKSDIIITVCDYTANILNSYCNVKGKTEKIVPSIICNKADKIIKNKDNGEIVLLTVARLEQRKGHCRVLDVMGELIGQFPEIHYNIVGTGPYEKVIKSDIERKGLSSNVHLLGKLSDADLKWQYENADIFVMPHIELENGDTEGCPTVFLEAGSYCLPVIGGDAGGVSDAIIHGQTGYICNHNQNGDLYNYLLELIKNKDLREKMGKAGHDYSQQFSVEKQSAKFSEIVVNTLNK